MNHIEHMMVCEAMRGMMRLFLGFLHLDNLQKLVYLFWKLTFCLYSFVKFS